jgi:hypothetical protein
MARRLLAAVLSTVTGTGTETGSRANAPTVGVAHERGLPVGARPEGLAAAPQDAERKISQRDDGGHDLQPERGFVLHRCQLPQPYPDAQGVPSLEVA